MGLLGPGLRVIKKKTLPAEVFRVEVQKLESREHGGGFGEHGSGFREQLHSPLTRL